jgi:CBS domain-containing protein
MEEIMEIVERFVKFPVASIDRSLTVVDAQVRMQAQKVSSLLVIAFQEYVGILTQTDIEQKVIAKGMDPHDTVITTAMTRSVISVDRFTTVEDAETFMRQKGIGHLAVTEQGAIVGVVSSRDLAASCARSSSALT